MVIGCAITCVSVSKGGPLYRGPPLEGWQNYTLALSYPHYTTETGLFFDKKKRGSRPLCYVSWGAGIRTPIGRSRVGSPTVERHPISVLNQEWLLLLANAMIPEVLWIVKGFCVALRAMQQLLNAET